MGSLVFIIHMFAHAYDNSAMHLGFIRDHVYLMNDNKKWIFILGYSDKNLISIFFHNYNDDKMNHKNQNE